MHASPRGDRIRQTGDEPRDGTPLPKGTQDVEIGPISAAPRLRPGATRTGAQRADDEPRGASTHAARGIPWGVLGAAGAGVLALGAGLVIGRSGATMASRLLVGSGAALLGVGLLAGCGRQGREPTPTPAPTPSVGPSAPGVGAPLRIAQLNAHNLFDTVDQPRVQDDVLTPVDYDRKLGKLALAIRDAIGSPDVIALQEVENERVLLDLAARPELRALGYVPLIVEGSDPRGIDVAYLYRPSTTELLAHDQLQTTYVSPSGRNIKVFTRPPLVATFRARGGSDGAQQGAALTIVNNHFTSKLQGEDGAAKRLRQAAFVASIADGRAGVAHLDPSRVIVLGDLNEDLDDPAYLSLVSPASEGAPAPRINAATHLPESDRYSWRDGTKRSLLDHVLLTPTLDAQVRAVRIPHINSDPSERFELDPLTYERSSDHDPVIVDLMT